jgi:chromosome segregation ATPase
MANNKKVISLGLDYSNFDGGITEVNRKMGLLDSQFKLATEQTKAFGTETDQLTLKHEALTQKINLVTQKVSLSKEAYDKAVSSGKASDKQLDNLQKAYTTNQTTLQKLNNELTDNKVKLDSANKSTETFGSSIRGMASSLGINVSPALEVVATKFDGVDASVGNAVLGIGAIIGAFASCTFSAANMADELLELSSVTGITTEELQKMQYASSFLDVEVETMTGSMTKLTRNMDDARKGSNELDEAFKTLHVRYKDGNNALLDSEKVFYDTIDALGKVKNETERDALAMTLLGKSAKDLNPLIEAGSKRLRELGIEAEDMGVIMSDTALEDLGAMKDSMDKLDSTVDALKNRLGLVLLPILSGVLDVISDIPTPVLAGIVVFAALTTVILLLAKTAQSMAVANALLAASNVAVGTTGGIATAGMGPLLLILLAIAAAIALIEAERSELSQRWTK